MKKLFILLIMIVPLTGMAQDIPGQYLVTAAENNPELKARFNEYMAALEVVPQVKSLTDPRLAFGYFIQPVETRVGPQQAKISVDQMFPWFGQLRAEGEVAAERAKAKYEVFEETKSRLFFEIKSAYYDLYFTNKAVEILLENIEIYHSFSELSLIKIESGLSSAVDQLRIDIEIGDIENELALLRDREMLQTVTFNNLLNEERDTPVFYPDTLIANDLQFNQQQVLDSILMNNHQLTMLDYELQAFENKEVAARKKGAPNINLGFDYIFVGQSTNPNLESGLSGKDAIMFPRIGLTIPLARKKYKAMVQETVYQQQAVDNQRESKTNALENLLEKAFKDYHDATRRHKLFQHQTILALQSMHILQTDYSTNNRDFEELLRMERRLLKYQLELEKAVTDKLTAEAFIEYLMGK